MSKSWYSAAFGILAIFFYIFELARSFKGGITTQTIYYYAILIFLTLVIVIVEIVRVKVYIPQMQFDKIPSLTFLLFILNRLIHSLLTYPLIPAYIGLLIYFAIEIPTWLFPSRKIFKENTDKIVHKITLPLLLISLVWALICTINFFVKIKPGS